MNDETLWERFGAIPRQKILDLAKNNDIVNHWLAMLRIEDDKASNRKWEQALMRIVISLVSLNETIAKTNSELIMNGVRGPEITINFDDLIMGKDAKQKILDLIKEALERER